MFEGNLYHDEQHDDPEHDEPGDLDVAQERARLRTRQVPTSTRAAADAGMAGVMPLTKAGPSATHTQAATINSVRSWGAGGASVE